MAPIAQNGPFWAQKGCFWAQIRYCMVLYGISLYCMVLHAITLYHMVLHDCTGCISQDTYLLYMYREMGAEFRLSHKLFIHLSNFRVYSSPITISFLGPPPEQYSFWGLPQKNILFEASPRKYSFWGLPKSNINFEANIHFEASPRTIWGNGACWHIMFLFHHGQINN